jgi:hypothetical protein
MIVLLIVGIVFTLVTFNNYFMIISIISWFVYFFVSMNLKPTDQIKNKMDFFEFKKKI